MGMIMNKKSRDSDDGLIICCVGLFVLFYLVPSLIGFLMGVSDANEYLFGPVCSKKWSKIEYIYPAYKFGCYMGKRE